MSHIKKNSVLKVIIFCFILIIINNYCFPWIWGNGAGGGYNENTLPPGIQSNISMESLLIEGAGYFLQTQSNIQTLLKMVEWQDIKFINYYAFNQLVKSSLNNIINARLSFEELIKVAEVTPYNLEVIGQLNRFDYDNFLKDNNLNPFIFDMVRDYLEKGDITGTFKYLSERLKEIEHLLLIIQEFTAENNLPGLSICWSLNERCAETTLFGSYIARIFNSIK
jgi:hypothetical protein